MPFESETHPTVSLVRAGEIGLMPVGAVFIAPINATDRDVRRLRTSMNDVFVVQVKRRLRERSRTEKPKIPDF
jgi:hypothetical protein